MDGIMPVQQEFLSKIIDYADSKNVEMIMGMDTNSHSTIYGNETKSRGEGHGRIHYQQRIHCRKYQENSNLRDNKRELKDGLMY